MKKKKLLKMLKFALDLEEKHTPVVTKFFLEDFDWTDVDKERVVRVKQILEVIKKQTLQHRTILEDLIELVKEVDGDEI
jgi:regulator of sigma D